jgi:hypothetical protein
MRIRWTIPAANDLQNIKNFLQQHYPSFAEPTVRSIYQSSARIAVSLAQARKRKLRNERADMPDGDDIALGVVKGDGNQEEHGQ